MNLPKLKKTIDGRKRQRATTFEQALGGYNHNLRTKAGEFYDMENISLDNYPVIGTRQGFAARSLGHNGTFNGIHEYKENTLMAVYGKYLYTGITANSDGTIVQYYDEDEEAWVPYEFENSFKSFATINTKTLIMPDKVLVDFGDGRQSIKIAKVEENYNWRIFDNDPNGDCYFMLRTVPCDIDGTVAGRIVESGPDDDEYTPSNPTDGMWWWRGFIGQWLQYDSSRAADDRWVKIEKPYTRVIPVLSNDPCAYGTYANPPDTAKAALEEMNNFFHKLKVLDSFNLAKEPFDEFDPGESDYTDYVIYGKRNVGGWGDQWGLSQQLTSVVIAEQATVNLVMFSARIKCPELRHIFALNNRIWGVTPNFKRYEDEPELTYPAASEIFCCKLGDPTQWYNYPNTAADSFALTLGSDTEVTAACAFNNTPHFFTEDSMLKVYGDYPANYQTREFSVDGVISGGDKTLVQVEGLLFWVSPVGVEAYEGSLPSLVSQDFEPNFLNGKTVAAGNDGTKYCLSVSHNGESDGIFTYDTQNGMWAKFADDIMRDAAELKNALCYVDQNGYLVTLHDRSREDDLIPTETDGVPIEWSLETGNLGLDTPNQKYISRVQMRIDFIGSLNVDISYDDSEYLPVHVSQSDHMKSITVPIKVRRCDHFKLKLSGEGKMRLYSFGYETDEGSARCLI